MNSNCNHLDFHLLDLVSLCTEYRVLVCIPPISDLSNVPSMVNCMQFQAFISPEKFMIPFATSKEVCIIFHAFIIRNVCMSMILYLQIHWQTHYCLFWHFYHIFSHKMSYFIPCSPYKIFAILVSECIWWHRAVSPVQFSIKIREMQTWQKRVFPVN